MAADDLPACLSVFPEARVYIRCCFGAGSCERSNKKSRHEDSMCQLNGLWSAGDIFTDVTTAISQKIIPTGENGQTFIIISKKNIHVADVRHLFVPLIAINAMISLAFPATLNKTRFPY